ncbi:MAG: phosphatidate cytidylyltransferase [Desulfovibrio sp.]|nr:phosphatidate cytidylyltransferase [Desulfovibrio sp.]MBI4961543.1 phosphatidate cytidylyltransferase [Desulfovibrio sp.]
MAISSHAPRLATAAVGLPVLAVCIWLGGGYIFALTLAVALIGLWEFQGFFPGSGPCIRALGLGLGAAMVWLGYRHGTAAALAVVLAAFWLEELARLFHKQDTSPRWLLAVSLLYIPGSLQFLTLFGPGETALVLASVMATDTGAYYAGHLIGGPKIWPSVSPKKTWAGSVGGLAAAVAVCLVAATFWGKASLVAFMALGVCLSVASQMGDFMESSLKRAAGIKDSGNLLPGHGGILDRIDGVIPAVLVYALARSLVNFL